MRDQQIIDQSVRVKCTNNNRRRKNSQVQYVQLDRELPSSIRDDVGDCGKSSSRCKRRWIVDV